MAIKNVLFDLGDTLWHFPKMPSTDHIRMETVRRVGETVKSWGVPFEGELRFLGRDIRLGVEKVDRAAYESDCVSPDFNEAVRQIVAGKGLDITYEQGAQLWIVDPHGNLVLRYDAGSDGKQILEDLRHLLKISQIG